MDEGSRDGIDTRSSGTRSETAASSKPFSTAIATVEAMADLATPFAVRLMATRRLADALINKPMRVHELAEIRGLDEATLRAVVHHLVAIGLLDQAEDGTLHVTETGAVLHTEAPGSLGHRFDLTGALGRADLAFVSLNDSLDSGRIAFDTFFGSDYWSVLRHDPALLDSFHRSMAQHDEHVAAALMASWRPAPESTVVDVGGGAGGVLVRLLKTYTDVHGVLVDLPEATAPACRIAQMHGLDDRLRIEPSDIRSEIPAGHAAYLLSMVLHDWPDDAARQILATCREAAPAGADLLVIEFDPETMPPSTASTIDLHLMMCAGATQRSIREHADLLASTGWGSWSVAARIDGIIAFRAK